MSGNLPVSGLEEVVQPLSSGDLMIISQETAGKFTSAQIPVEEFLSKLFDENSGMGGQFTDLSTQLKDLEARVDILETNPAIRNFAETVFHVGSKHMTTSTTWNPGEALRPFFGKRTNWILYPYVPYGVVSEDVPLGGIIPLLKGNGTSVSNMRIWERLPDNAGNWLITIKPNKTAANEGDEVEFDIIMIGVEPGTLVDYQILGIDETDIDVRSEAKLSGQFVNGSSGINKLKLRTIANRRTDGDRTVTLALATYNATGTFTLIDSSKALDGLINVPPGSSQIVTLAPGQQADVWVTGAGGSGGISKGLSGEVATEANFISKSVLAGSSETVSLQPGEEVEVWLWGGGGDSGGAWVATAPIPTSEFGNGEASKVVIGSAVFTAGGGLGYTESAMAVKDGIRYAATPLPGGANSIISGDYNGLEVTVLENVNGNAGSISRTHTSPTWGVTQSLEYGTYGRNDVEGIMHGAGGTGIATVYIADVANSISTYRIEGGGAGGFLKLRVKNPTRGVLTFQSTAGKAGRRYDAINLTLGMGANMRYAGKGGLDGVVQVVKPTTKEIVRLKANESRNITIPAGKSAEIWVIGSGGAGNSYGNYLTQGDASSITIGSAKYIAGGGGVSTYLPGSGSGGAESYPIPGKTTVPSSGLPADVVVDILENREGYPTTIKKNEYNVWTHFLTKDTYVNGYGPFAGTGYAEAFGIMMNSYRAPAAGAVLGLKVTNNGSTPLVIPAVAAKQSIAYVLNAATPGVKVDEYETGYRAHGGYGTVLAFIDGGGTSTTADANYIKSSIKGGVTENVILPAGDEIELWLWGGGGSSGCPRFNSEWTPKNGDGGDSKLVFEGNSYIAGGGKGHDEALQKSFGNGWYAMDVNRPGGVNSILTPNVLSGVVITVIENKAGLIGTKATTAFSRIYGALGHTDLEGDCIGNGGTGETYPVGSGNTAATITLGGGGSGGFLRLRIKNNRTQSITLPVTVGAGGSRSNKDYLILTGNNGGEGQAQVVEFKNVDVINPALNTSSTFTLPKGKSAEIWLVGAGAAVTTAFFGSPLGIGDPSSVTIGTAKYIAGGGDQKDGVTTGGVTTIPVSGLPTGVEVTIIENKAGAKPIKTATVDGYTGISQEVFNIKGYGPFGATPDAVRWRDYNFLQYASVGAGGALLAIKVTNNSATDLVIPYVLGRRQASDSLTAEGNVNNTPQAFGGKPTVLAFIDGGNTSSNIDIIEDSVGFNGQWSYVAFQSPLISGSSSQYIEEIYWSTDEAGNNRIEGANPYGDHAYLIIKTIDVEDSVELVLSANGLTQEEMGGGQLDETIKIPISKIGSTNKGIGSYLIQTLDDDEMSFRNSKYVGFVVGTERIAGTDYVNNTDYTIEVILMVSDVGTVKPFKVTVGDYAPIDVRDLGDPSYDQQFTVKVPPGVKYRVDANGNIIRKWSELRYKGIK